MARSSRPQYKKRKRRVRWGHLLVVLVICAAFTAAALHVLRRLGASQANPVSTPVHYSEQIYASATRHEVDPYLVAAVIKVESNWDAGVQSHAGAVGLMQLLPSTAETMQHLGYVSSAYAVNNLQDGPTSIEFGSAYLQYLSQHLDNEVEVIAAYNAGLAAVQSWLSDGRTLTSSNIPYGETSAYVDKVLAAYDAYKAAFPEHLSDTIF